MKKFINIIVTVFLVVILKGCILAPIYIVIAPIVTSIRWGMTRKAICCAFPFEIRCVWHTLRNDWRDGCNAMVFDLED